MWPARLRVLDAIPPESVEEVTLRVPGAKVALRCFTPGCRKCSEFAVEESVEFEQRRLGDVSQVVPWDCSDPKKRDFAMNCGVDKVPAYLVLHGTNATVVSV